MAKFDVQAFRELFPLINNSSEVDSLIYFDNAATTQKSAQVIQAYQDYYHNINSNVHRASHQLSAKATLLFEHARKQVQHFLNAKHIQEIIWTKGTTESINLVAQSWGRTNLGKGDEIVLSYAEHHANIVPWQLVAEQTGAIIKVLPLNASGVIDLPSINDMITTKTKMVSISHISNVVGKVNPVKEVVQRAKEVGALTLIDGAQAVGHQKVDIQKLDCDFYVFSAHKMFGPTGVGVLYGRRSELEKMPPYQGGGEMIKKVTFDKTSFNSLPFKFEPGTPNISGIIAFSAALTLHEQLDNQAITNYERSLTQYCYQQLTAIKELSFICQHCPDIPVFSFQINAHHNHDVATALDAKGIAVRTGHHCAMPLMQYLGLEGCIRISLAAYNTFEEVDQVIAILKEIITPKERDTKTIDDIKNEGTESDEYQAVIERFKSINSWDARHREIMLIGKRLNKLSVDKRNEETLITGCESNAWLYSEQNSSGQFYFTADSDAKVIRGLLVIVLAAFNGKNAQQIQAFNVKDYFENLGLIKHLSPSRSNGLTAIVERVKRLAGG